MHDPYAPLRYRNFRWLILAHGISTVAREAQIVVVSWQVYEVTKDPLSLGFIGLAEALPFIGVALYAGHIADRGNRRGIALAGTFGVALSAVALLLFTFQPALLQAVWPIYAVIFASGIARSFTRPSVTALSAEIIPREIYSSAVAWRSSTWQGAAITGPALGGMLYGFSGPKLAYGVVVALFAAALAALGAITHKSEPLPSDMPLGERLRVGLRFRWRQPL